MVAFLMVPAAAAAADDLIVIPVSGFARGEEGDVITIATVDVPSDLIGATCQITGLTVNQISVHEGNDLLINTNGQTFVVPNFEDAGFIEHEAGEVASVGTTIQLQLRFGPDGLSSGGFRVRVDCDPENFPTTTVNDSTTTTTTEEPGEPSTSETTVDQPPAGPTTEAVTTTVPATSETTESPSTSVAANPPTTDEEPPAGPTTEAPVTTVPSATEAPATTTTAAPTTAAPTSEEPPAGPEADDDAALPVTGSSTRLILGFGAVFIAVGVALRRFASVAI